MSPLESPNAPASIAASTSRDHRRQLGVRSTVAPPAPRTDAADRPVPDEERDVEPSALRLDRVEVLPERPPPRDQAVAAEATARRARDRRSVIGASVSPQLPDSWVVNPWRRWLTSAPSTNSDPSECPCGSMNPGATTSPSASITCADLAVIDRRQVVDREDPVAEDPDVGATARATRCHR